MTARKCSWCKAPASHLYVEGLIYRPGYQPRGMKAHPICDACVYRTKGEQAMRKAGVHGWYVPTNALELTLGGPR